MQKIDTTIPRWNKEHFFSGSHRLLTFKVKGMSCGLYKKSTFWRLSIVPKHCNCSYSFAFTPKPKQSPLMVAKAIAYELHYRSFVTGKTELKPVNRGTVINGIHKGTIGKNFLARNTEAEPFQIVFTEPKIILNSKAIETCE